MITIDRKYFEDCTLGRLRALGFQCFTLELPDFDNARNISCIPEGEYDARLITSPSNGKCIEIMNVPNRTHIQIHSANFTRQILGCVAVGDGIKDLNHDTIPDVSNSKRTLEKLLNVLPETFKVRITS